MSFSTAKNWLAQLLTYSQCETCERPVAAPPAICDYCEQKLIPLNEFRCLRCALPLALNSNQKFLCENCQSRPPSFETVWSPWIFEGIVPELIKIAKYEGRPGPLLWLVKRAEPEAIETLLDWEPDGMVPVPLHWRRLLKRGYNQSAILADHWRRSLSRDLPIITEGIQRTNHLHQAGLNRKDRLASLREVFRIKKTMRFRNKRLLIIDDVMTTGATVEALSQCLLAARASAVAVLVLARVEKLA